MRFSEPFILYFLILVPIIYVITVWTGKKRLREITELGTLHTLERFSKRELSGNFRLDGLFISAAFLFIIFSFARPQAGSRLEPVKITGSDIYVAIDLSKSMTAEDIKPNRFDRAKINALELVKSLKGDRVGLILFAGDAFVLCPLTNDYDAVITFINSLNLESAAASGTSLFAPLEVALNSIKPREDKYALLLLLTDGENTGENNVKILRDIQKRKIKIFSIGIGTKHGAPIPIYDENGKRVGYKKDSEGNVVISKLDDSLLKEIAEKTGGYYFEAGERMNEIRKFLSTVQAMKKRELETKKYTVYEERFQIPLSMGILFLLLYIFRTVKTKRRES
ncbi:MAG: VWA domain-containing protein [Spirochaetes bacterium]|nr:VWA domain-containing protein [Spirochaetota bacterium]